MSDELTMIRRAFHLDEETAEAKSRIALIAILGCNLRMMENWRALQSEAFGRVFDFESTLILMSIAVIRGDWMLRTTVNPNVQTLANPLPEELATKCNVSSIASATSLNRETVRRRVKKLESWGVVQRDSEGGIRLTDGRVQSPQVRRELLRQLRLIIRTVNELSRHGIFK